MSNETWGLSENLEVLPPSESKPSRDNQADVAANAAPPNKDAENAFEQFAYDNAINFALRIDEKWRVDDVAIEFGEAYAESVAAPLRAEIARLNEEHEADRKFIRFYRGECARHGMTGRVDIDGWPIQLTNERAATLEAENSTLRARIAELEAQLENLAEVASFKESEAVDEYRRAEAAEKRVATLREALKKLKAEVMATLGLIEPEMRRLLGDSNVNLLKLRCFEALAALRDQEGQ